MPQSTLLLFKLIRRRVALGMGVAFFLFLSLSKPPNEYNFLILLPSTALVLTSLTGLHTFLSRTLFPVTDRQVAWIPQTVWGLVTLSGLAGLAAGQGIAALAGLHSFPGKFIEGFPAIHTLPLILFLLLLMWRVVRLSPIIALFAMIFLSLNLFLVEIILRPLSQATHHSTRSSLIPSQVADACLTWWPVWLLGCLFLVWEAPQQTSTLRHLDLKEKNGSTAVPNFRGPLHRTWATYFVDTLILLGLALNFLKIFTRQEDHFPSEFIFLLPLFIFGLVQTWKEIRGSGLGRVRSVALSLLGMTLVGYLALRDRLGVARGAVVRCPACQNWRMVWYRECPHCTTRQPAAPQNFPSPLKTLLWPRHDPAALFFRGILLLLIVFFCIYVRILIR